MHTDSNSRRYNFRRLRPGIATPTRGPVSRLGDLAEDTGRVISPDVSDGEGWGDPNPDSEAAAMSSLTDLKDERTVSPSQEREDSHQESGGQEAIETSPEENSGVTPEDPDKGCDTGGQQGDHHGVNDHSKPSREIGHMSRSHQVLTQEQEKTVELARKGLTTAQRKLVKNRNRAMNMSSETEQEQIPETVTKKGKGIDPREWGQINVENEQELNPEVQERLFRKYKTKQQNTKVNSPDKEDDSDYEPVSDETSSDESGNDEMEDNVRENLSTRKRRTQVEKLEARIKELKKKLHKERKKHKGETAQRRGCSIPLSSELGDLIDRVTTRRSEPPKEKGDKIADQGRPSTYIGENSALGQTFRRIREDSELESEMEDSEEEEDMPRHHKEKRARAGRKEEIYQTLIRPTPPKKYNGEPDLEAFQQFMTQVSSYLKFGYVPRERHVLTVSNFLKGRAWTYYSRVASRAPEEWSLNRFFTGLFNECFPLDFRNKQRETLKNYTQGKLSVRDYSAGLEELFTVVGHINKREKVVKLFTGYQKGVQKRLYLMGLNSETSQWEEIIEKATYVERADSLDWDDKGSRRNEGGRKSDMVSHHRTEGPRGYPSKLRGDSFKGNKRQGAETGSPIENTKTVPGRGKHHPKFPAARSGGERNLQNEDNKRKLSKEEEDEYRAADKCFGCGGVGHFSRNCPRGRTAKASSSKPPGVKSFSIHVPTEGPKWEAE
ncbi:hypothetical protein C0993_002011 [Termitomyces sp. T159_Od127]|nr:hypothetical protein C0993_002011 [Termitomyces sp. T159_Od127]